MRTRPDGAGDTAALDAVEARATRRARSTLVGGSQGRPRGSRRRPAPEIGASGDGAWKQLATCWRATRIRTDPEIAGPATGFADAVARSRRVVGRGQSTSVRGARPACPRGAPDLREEHRREQSRAAYRCATTTRLPVGSGDGSGTSSVAEPRVEGIPARRCRRRRGSTPGASVTAAATARGCNQAGRIAGRLPRSTLQDGSLTRRRLSVCQLLAAASWFLHAGRRPPGRHRRRTRSAGCSRARTRRGPAFSRRRGPRRTRRPASPRARRRGRPSDPHLRPLSRLRGAHRPLRVAGLRPDTAAEDRAAWQADRGRPGPAVGTAWEATRAAAAPLHRGLLVHDVGTPGRHAPRCTATYIASRLPISDRRTSLAHLSSRHRPCRPSPSPTTPTSRASDGDWGGLIDEQRARAACDPRWRAGPECRGLCDEKVRIDGQRPPD